MSTTETLPKISIVINNYNYACFLAQAIDSALAQTYAQTEVLVVDDCSTDNSRSIIEGYGDRIIPILHKTNGKQGAAFNSGFAKSKGDIIIFLDADDFLYPQAAERIADIWQPGLAKVHYRLQVIDREGQVRDFSYPQGNQLDRGDIYQTILKVGTYVGVPTSGNALTRKALAQVMPIPEEFATTSDDYLSVLIPLYGEIAAVDIPLGGYRIHTTNQWAMTEVTSDRFHRFIRHDLQRCELIQQHGRQLGYEVPEDLYMRFFGRAWSRLASLKLDAATHPVPGDRATVLVRQGIKALWRYSQYNWQKRVIFSLWFLWVGIMPCQLAKPAIDWLFSPQTRPQIVGKTLSRLKALVTSKAPAQANHR